MLHTFGPFQLDSQRRRLTRTGEPVSVSDRQIDILLLLLAHAGQVVSKDALVQAAWKDVAVADNSLEQAISGLRRALGEPEGGGRYIETLARRGYRLAVTATTSAGRQSDEVLAALLAPYRAFIEGRAALETLDRDAVAKAVPVFESITRVAPDDPSAHLGLANALALALESERATGARTDAMVAKARHHASEACRLDPESGEAWAVLGLVSHQARDREQAVAALRRAVAIDPDNWRHHVRLAYVSWGEERLRAAQRALTLFPRFPFAHWLAATVHVARQALPLAEKEIVAGAAEQDRGTAGAPFQTVGLHGMLGLVRLATGDEGAALAELEQEAAASKTGNIYAHEASANAWCGIAAIRLRRAQPEAALAALDRAFDVVPGHLVALAARAAVAHRRPELDEPLARIRGQGRLVEAAFAEAVFETICGNPSAAAAMMLTAVEQTPVDSSAWRLPIDPFLNVQASPQHWMTVLSLLRDRAA